MTTRLANTVASIRPTVSPLGVQPVTLTLDPIVDSLISGADDARWPDATAWHEIKDRCVQSVADQLNSYLLFSLLSDFHLAQYEKTLSSQQSENRSRRRQTNEPALVHRFLLPARRR